MDYEGYLRNVLSMTERDGTLAHEIQEFPTE